MKPVTMISLGALAALGTLTAAANLAALGFVDDLELSVQGAGSLKGAVQLAQSHAVFPRDNEVRHLPQMVQDRAALLIYVPHSQDGALRTLRVTARQGSEALGTLEMAAPSQFPKSDQIETTTTQVEYSNKAWSVQLPWHWMKPGLSFSIESDTGLRQTVSDIEVRAPSELILQHIRVGMLTPPPAATLLETHPATAAVDYFQKIPVSRLVVAQYQPVQFDRITMPNGTVYTQASATIGGDFDGDMREAIGKALVSVGINLANYGISSSAGSSQSQPGYFAQIVVHHSQGHYANGVKGHCFSGGNGMATVFDTTGNEFSHELGHAFGLGHYPEGFTGSVHSRTAGWGYDAYRHRMVGNFDWSSTEARTAFNQDVGQFASHPYGYDAMAGGMPMGAVSRYTQHTGFAANWIQKALASYGVVDVSSTSGWRRWDDQSKTMAVLNEPARRKPAAVVRDGVLTLVGYYDPQGVLPSTIYPGLWGSYGMTYASEAVAPTAATCRLVVNGGPGSTPWVSSLSASRFNSSEMNKFHVNVPQSMNPSSATVECARGGVWSRLASATLQEPAGFKAKVTEVGRVHGFGAIAQDGLRLSDAASPSSRPMASMEATRRMVTDAFGPIQAWNSADPAPQGGRVYEYDNPYTGDVEYFLLKSSTQYGYFPINKTSNAQWHYLGSAAEVTNLTPNPLALRRLGLPTADAAVLKYYGATSFKSWCDHCGGVVGDLYAYDNPHTLAREYFRLRTPQYGYFPITKVSNQHWEYLGDAPSLTQVITTTDSTVLDAAVKAWYRKSRLYTWGEGGNQGTPGNLYKGGEGYFLLKTPSYGYFPTNQASNGHWEYLGAP